MPASMLLTYAPLSVTIAANIRLIFDERIIMHARFLGVDPGSQEGQSPTLFATDRRDRKTYIAQGWVVTDPQALADVGPVPDGEAVVEIPADVLEFYVRDREMR